MLRNLLVGTGLAAFTAIGSANALLIDNFNNPTTDPFQTTCVGPGTGGTCNAANSSSSYTGAGIIGGTRDVTTVRNGAGVVGNETTTFVSALGVFTHSQDSQSNATTTITWNAAGAGLGGVDLTDGGLSNMFHFRIASADVGIEWRLEVTDNNSTDSITFSTAAALVDADLYRGFNLFTGIDFTQISSIRFTANNGQVPNVDTAIDQIDTIPEPATMTLLGVGLAGIALAARRRRKAA